MIDLNRLGLLKALRNYTVNSDGCFIYNGSKNSDGYANSTMRINGKCKPYKLHRAALAIKLNVQHENILLACHMCSNRNCINPNHLYNGSDQSNVNDSIDDKTHISLVHKAKTHCPQGHEYHRLNTVINNGLRSCKTCRADARIRYNKRKKEEKKALLCQSK